MSDVFSSSFIYQFFSDLYKKIYIKISFYFFTYISCIIISLSTVQLYFIYDVTFFDCNESRILVEIILQPL